MLAVVLIAALGWLPSTAWAHLTGPLTPGALHSSDISAQAADVPAGYSVDVDESGATTSGNLGGGGSLQGSGQGNVNYGFARECAPSQDGGPFYNGYPPGTCAQVGRAYNTTGSPEQPPGSGSQATSTA